MHVENICYICCARKNNGTSCGNLLLFKNNIAVTGLATVVDAKAKPIGRADRYLFSRIRGAGMSVVAGTIYAHTSIGPTGVNLKVLKNLAGFSKTLNIPWFFVGDVNVLA